ncbi:hypothetical protein M8C21_002197, partial [Ambrosia artemisiifolia]
KARHLNHDVVGDQSVNRVLEIRRRFVTFVNAVDSPDHIVLAYHMIEACLMGFSLFLLVTVNSLHQYIKEVIMVKETIRAAKKQNQAYEDCMKKSAEEAEIIRKDISRLKTEIANLESECSLKEQAAQLLRADSSILKNKLEGCLEKYDRLLTYNKDLKEQLQGVNERSSHSNVGIGGACDGKTGKPVNWISRPSLLELRTCFLNQPQPSISCPIQCESYSSDLLRLPLNLLYNEFVYNSSNLLCFLLRS